MHSYMLIINPTGPCFSTCAAQPVSVQPVFIKCPVLRVVILPTAACHFLVPDALSLAFYSWDNPLFQKAPSF